jgi:D-alanyl-lipoteichoic acid acyltransferase DltB (MBOAT superfamily)
MFVADNLARIADAVFAPAAHPGSLAVLMGTVAFAFQIYGDFSGYSDIARGTSKLMGIELNVNFRPTSSARRRSSGGTGTSVCRRGFGTTCSCP